AGLAAPGCQCRRRRGRRPCAHRRDRRDAVAVAALNPDLLAAGRRRTQGPAAIEHRQGRILRNGREGEGIYPRRRLLSGRAVAPDERALRPVGAVLLPVAAPPQPLALPVL